MKEIKVKESFKGTYVCVKDAREATHVVLELSTYQNLMRLLKERAIQARGLEPRKHSGYKVMYVKTWDEPHAKTRMPSSEYESWNPDESLGLPDQMKKLDFFEKRRETKKMIVQCYTFELQTPYKISVSEQDLDQIMYGELFGEILPKLGFKNEELQWPEPGYAPFFAVWKKENGQYVIANTVYRILLSPNVDDGYWYVQVYATAVPSIPDEMK